MKNFPIYCINLEHRKDRKEHTIEQFKKLNINHDNVIYPHFIKDNRGGIYGVFDSHMKVWNDFFVKHPNQNYCLVFEDDFVIFENSKSIIKKAIDFIEKNYKDIDILFLHNLKVNVDNNINNKTFNNGYGITACAYFINRHYIQSIITKYGKLPEPNGKHVDVELTMNNLDKDNWIYSEKIFFTNKPCIKQLENSKSDNCNNSFDELFRQNTTLEHCVNTLTFIKKGRIMNDTQLKSLFSFIANTYSAAFF